MKGKLFKWQVRLMLLLVFNYASIAKGVVGSQQDSTSVNSDDLTYEFIFGAANGRESVIVKCLNKGVEVDATLDENETALMMAAKGGHTQICKFLLSKGADINKSMNSGFTALILATKYHKTSTAKLLIEKGAKVDQKDDAGRTALHYAAYINDTILCGNLLEYKADINMPDFDGTTPLLAAISNNQYDAAFFLLAKGADVNKQDLDGISTLMMAVGKNNREIVELLFKNKVNPDLISKHRESALSMAIRDNNYAMVKLLIDRGANVNKKLRMAETPFFIAKNEHVNDSIIEILRFNDAESNKYPSFRTFYIGPEVSFHSDDFMNGFVLGIKEVKYGFDISAGVYFRPYAKQVLLPHNGNIYYQFWEKRTMINIGVLKMFNVKIGESFNNFVNLGARAFVSFADYKGTNLNNRKEFIFVPEVGFSHSFRILEIGINYQYIDLKLEELSVHRIGIVAKLLFGNLYSSRNSINREWE